MKLKKLFAGVVAAAMIATMSFPAFAAMGGSATVNMRELPGAIQPASF